ncbi:chitosanase [Streptomyces glaucescens]|uniref:Chitosanase n=1 Tax=Streptomyces glaucescens TaxID=1907 RepID=A0A089YW65_STRGA|nr:chitosanase [Streptomyces glaucescens]AIR97845.1 Chitosanase [Streptomyces glaucescens]
MKRTGCLLLAAVPVLVTAAAALLFPAGSSEVPGERAAASQQAREDAKAKAERAAAAERAADDKVIAGLPPGLAAPGERELAHRILATSTASTLDWRASYGSIEDHGDGRGYTAGIAGFCTGTHDLLALVERYTEDHPDNGLARYLPALRAVDGTDSHEGLDPGFTEAWKAEAEVPAFQRAQEEERDRVYFDPAVRLAKLDGLGTLGQFVYYDAMVFHGPDTGPEGFYGMRELALDEAATPATGGDETAYLDAFLDIRRDAMLARKATADTSRIDTAQRRWLNAGNLELNTPLEWSMYGETYKVP